MIIARGVYIFGQRIDNPIGEAMEILMLTPYFVPHVGGVETHVKRVSEELVGRGNKVLIFTRKHLPDLPETEFLDGISLYRIPEEGRRGIWRWMWWNRRLIKSAKVIHCHDYATFYYWYLPFRFLYLWKPVFVTFHGYEKYPPDRKTVLIRRIVEKLSSGSFCVGSYISKWYGARCDKLIWGGVDAIPERVIREKEESAVFVGRLEKDTGIIEYLNALKIIKNKYGEKLRLYVCGDGRLKNHISEMSQRNRLDVIFCGIVDQPLEYFLRCKYAFVSGYLTILEAMMAKSLVFSVYSNPLKKDYLALIPHASDIMIIAPNSEHIAKKLMEVRHSQSAFEKMISKARMFAMEHPWSKIADAYVDSYIGKVGID